ncbi:MAG: hypothetical protein HY835_09455 [Anaerolineae bacterium]|nr:hypothetical protein [Anaerolineae bacterium]
MDGGGILLGVGVLLSSYHLMNGLVELFSRMWKRIFMTWARRRLTDLGIVQTSDAKPKPALNIKRLSIFLVIPLLALAVRDYLLSPLMVVFGALIIVWLDFQARQKEIEKVNEDAEIAALQVRSLLQVDRSLLNALNGIQIPDGALKRSLQQVISRLQMHQPPEEAVGSLQGLPGTITARLSALIANSARTTDDMQSALLQTLEQEAHRQKLLRSKIRQTLALVRGTIRLLQGATAAALVFVLLSPTWRTFFLQDIPHRTLMTVLIVCAVLASLYFEYEVYQMGSSEAFS